MVSAALERLEPVLDVHGEAAGGRRERARLLGGDEQLVPPRHVELRAGRARRPRRRCRARTARHPGGRGRRRDARGSTSTGVRAVRRRVWGWRSACGQILTHIVIQATGGPARPARDASVHDQRRDRPRALHPPPRGRDRRRRRRLRARRRHRRLHPRSTPAAPRAYAAAHLPGAISLPHRGITTRRCPGGPDRRLLLGPGLQRAPTKAAAKIAALGREVKEMIGGFEYYVREGYPVEGEQAEPSQQGPEWPRALPGAAMVGCSLPSERSGPPRRLWRRPSEHGDAREPRRVDPRRPRRRRAVGPAEALVATGAARPLARRRRPRVAARRQGAG